MLIHIYDQMSFVSAPFHEHYGGCMRLKNDHFQCDLLAWNLFFCGSGNVENSIPEKEWDPFSTIIIWCTYLEFRLEKFSHQTGCHWPNVQGSWKLQLEQGLPHNSVVMSQIWL